MGKSCIIGAKMFLLEQNWLYFGKSGCIRNSGCIGAKVLYSGRSCCILAKVVVFEQSGCIPEK